MSLLRNLVCPSGIFLVFFFSGTPLPGGEEKDSSAPKEGSGKVEGKKSSGVQDDQKGKKASEKTSGDSEKSGKSGKKDAGAAEEADLALVKEKLKEVIHGNVTFNEGGTVTIEYDFKTKKETFQNDFRPPISTKPQDYFRWSVYQEEHVIGGDYGIRISDRGMSVLNVWFVDDLEATATYLQGVSWSSRQVCALVFQAKGGTGFGNNYGGQCANFAGATFRGGVPPATEQLPFNEVGKFTLRVKGGTFETLRNDKPRKSAKYSPRTFASGRIGFIWSGNVAGTLTTLSIKGKLDTAAMAKEIRKATGAK